jgi:hypothetical protein
MKAMLEGVESELDWLRDVVLIGVAMAVRNHINFETRDSTLVPQNSPKQKNQLTSLSS